MNLVIYLLICSTSILTGLFSPYLGFFMVLISLYSSRGKGFTFDKKLLVIFLGIFGAAIAASRRSLYVESDDMIRYYELFLFSDDEALIFLDPAFRFIYSLLYSFDKNLSITLFIFLHSFVIYLLSITIVFKSKFVSSVTGPLLATYSILFSFLFTTQLPKFFLAYLLVFYTIFCTNNLFSKLLSLTFAFLTHATAPIVFAFNLIAIKSNRFYFVLAIIICAILGLTFSTISSFIINTGIPGLDRLDYSIQNITEVDTVGITSIISVLFYMSLIELLHLKRQYTESFILYRKYFSRAILFSIFLLPINSVASRMLFIINMCIIGLVLGEALSNSKFKNINITIVIFLIALKAYSYSGVANDELFLLWHQYPIINTTPLYYLLK